MESGREKNREEDEVVVVVVVVQEENRDISVRIGCHVRAEGR